EAEAADHAVAEDHQPVGRGVGGERGEDDAGGVDDAADDRDRPRPALVLQPAAEIGADEDHPDRDREGQGCLHLRHVEVVGLLECSPEDRPRVHRADRELQQEGGGDQQPAEPTGRDVVVCHARAVPRGSPGHTPGVSAGRVGQCQRTTIACSPRSTTSPMTGNPGISPATSRPPEVWASASRMSSSSSTALSRSGCTHSRLRRLPPGTKPSASEARAPSTYGTAAAWITAVVPEARSILRRCPSSPNPVTSVAARIPRATACSLASRLSVVITATASGNQSPVALCRLLRMPRPRGLVRVSGVPGSAASLRSSLSGWASPVTATPYFGSGSSML